MRSSERVHSRSAFSESSEYAACSPIAPRRRNLWHSMELASLTVTGCGSARTHGLAARRQSVPSPFGGRSLLTTRVLRLDNGQQTPVYRSCGSQRRLGPTDSAVDDFDSERNPHELSDRRSSEDAAGGMVGMRRCAARSRPQWRVHVPRLAVW
jgi:hypothetical protein